MALKRVLETEYMDTHEEAVDYDSMDHSTVNQQFVADLLQWEDVSGDLLDLGTGTAQIPIVLCKQAKDVRIMAADMAVHMLELARYNLEVESLTDRIELVQSDAKSLPLEDDLFDGVISNSIVHHIPEPEACLAEAIRVTKPGGFLFFRDLMRPESDEVVRNLVETYAGEENDHQKQMFDDSLRAALSLQEIQLLVSQFGFDSGTVSATSDRHWTWAARKA
ncbi:MAG: class I SAM-dependent methyltransferase [Planctomycetota bacterium]|nr:class I SAM-dependent methyltransferase [Planctomycetota bacterium]